MMMRVLLATALAAVAVLGSVGLAQAPAFDVVSVKRNLETAGRSAGVEIRPEQLDAIWIPVQALIGQAYGVSAARMVGMPDWVRTERYDVRARAPKPSTRQEMLAMLQTLLVERFAIKVHRETREMDVYALALIKPGSLGRGLKPVVVDCDTNTLLDGSGPGLFPPDQRPPCGNTIATVRFRVGEGGGGGQSVRRTRSAAVTMERFALGLGGAGRPVIDRTGLSGTFDVEMEYLNEGAPVVAPTSREPLTGLTLRESLEEHLGLELRPERGPIEHLVIDSIARPTAD